MSQRSQIIIPILIFIYLFLCKTHLFINFYLFLHLATYCQGDKFHFLLYKNERNPANFSDNNFLSIFYPTYRFHRNTLSGKPYTIYIAFAS